MKKKNISLLLIFCLLINLCIIIGFKDYNYNPVLKPENFVDKITNPYFPLTPGNIMTYNEQSKEGIATVVVEVLSKIKTVSGIKCTVVRDTVSIKNVLVEDTYDWFAQDKDGNVWYMGEYVSNYKNGKVVDHEGSFEAGVDQALPGIIMLANIVLEMPYRQEYYENKAEDWGKVVEKGATVTTAYGTFKDCIKTLDWDGLDSKNKGAIEYKYYSPGIGFVKGGTIDSSETIELVKVE